MGKLLFAGASGSIKLKPGKKTTRTVLKVLKSSGQYGPRAKVIVSKPTVRGKPLTKRDGVLWMNDGAIKPLRAAIGKVVTFYRGKSKTSSIAARLA